MEKQAYDKKDVLEIFGITNNTLDSWEEQGYIRRMNIPGRNPKYSKAAIEKLLFDGTDNLLIRKEKEIQELRLENLRLTNKLNEIREVMR